MSRLDARNVLRIISTSSDDSDTLKRLIQNDGLFEDPRRLPRRDKDDAVVNDDKNVSSRRDRALRLQFVNVIGRVSVFHDASRNKTRLFHARAFPHGVHLGVV